MVVAKITNMKTAGSKPSRTLIRKIHGFVEYGRPNASKDS